MPRVHWSHPCPTLLPVWLSPFPGLQSSLGTEIKRLPDYFRSGWVPTQLIHWLDLWPWTRHAYPLQTSVSSSATEMEILHPIAWMESNRVCKAPWPKVLYATAKWTLRLGSWVNDDCFIDRFLTLGHMLTSGAFGFIRLWSFTRLQIEARRDPLFSSP